MTTPVLATAPETTHPLTEVRSFYDRGLYVQAYRLGEQWWGPPQDWPGIDGRVLAARVSDQLGGARRGGWLARRAYRQAPENPEARYYYALGVLRRRGPYLAGRWIQTLPDLAPDTTPDVRSSWYALRARVAGSLRDFDAAEQWLSRAREIAPDSAWVLCSVADVLQDEDRYDEALTMARRALEVQPLYRPAVQILGHLLTLVDRDEDALELLGDAAWKLESGAVAAQLFTVQLEMKDYDACGKALERMTELVPLAEKPMRQWIAAQWSEVSYYLGDLPGAIRWAQESDSAYHKAIAERLQDPARADGRSIIQPVPFVRQHHVTCAPATLVALGQFWKQPADHLEVAEAICYNGTPAYNERRWAREHGWAVREFSVTEAGAAALIDRGVPFTFTTVEPGNSHLQAIIGYDGRRGTLHIRDPYWRNTGEGLADKVLERYRAHGPRGMAMVPLAEAHRLEGVELPDAELWDLLHEFDGGLEAHRREDAARALEQMAQVDAGHRLTLEARRRLARYDANASEHLAAIEGLAEQFPADQTYQLERLSCLRNQARRDDRLATYARMCAQEESHPIFWQQYAQELRADARRHPEAERLLLRAIRRWPTEASTYYILANIYWDQRRFEDALGLYRLAVCLNDKDEQLALDYFHAARSLKRAEEVLQLLRARFARYGGKSWHPARTLATAYRLLDREPEAIAAVERAMTLRPEDGQLLLFAADVYVGASVAHLPRALELMEKARGRTPRAEWLRTRARLASYDGRLGEALEHWQEVLALQPLALDAHVRVAHLLEQTQGPAAALAHLQQAAERFPHHGPLHELWLERLREEPFARREPVMHTFLAANPDNAWAHREWGFWLAGESRWDEAWHEADVAGRLEPTHPSYHLLRGEIYRQRNQMEEARQEVRAAIELSVDNDFAISTLVDLCPTPPLRREALRFVKDQLITQVIRGDGLLAFRAHAGGALEPQEVTALLRDGLAARPDLWHAWSALVQQLLHTDQLEEAWGLVQQAAERFPLMPRVWQDRAEVCRARHDLEGERAALEEAYHINPTWGLVVRSLADADQRLGEFDKARALLEHGVGRNPLDAPLHLALGEALWRQERREDALERVKRAVELEPGYERAWEVLNAYADRLERPHEALDTARELTRRRPGEARSWYMLARLLDDPEQAEERLGALEKVLELNPRHVDAHDFKARTLAAQGRWDEAEAACAPAVFEGHLPTSLRARVAWLHAERGDLPGAIARMRAALEDDPHFYGGWSRLADWCQQVQDNPGALAASQAMVRLSPQYEVSWGYLGEARLRNDDRPGALEAFRRAFALEPQYEWAGNELFDLQFKDGDLSGAAATLEKLRRHSDSPFVLGRAAQLASRTNEKDEAIGLLRTLCTAPGDVRWALGAATEAAAEAFGAATIEAVLRDAMAREDADAMVGVHWLDLCLAHQLPCLPLVEVLAGRTAAAQHATYGLMRHWIQERQGETMRSFAARNAEWLRAVPLLWGGAGWALTALRYFDKAAAWHSDWRTRDGVAPWMLVNAAEAFRAQARDDEAVACSRRALELGREHGTQLHHLLLASDAALGGDVAAAEAHLAEVTEREELDPDYQFLLKLILALLPVAKAAPAARDAVVAEARRSMAEARAQFADYKREPARRRAYRAFTRRLARLSNLWSSWLWHCWQLLGS